MWAGGVEVATPAFDHDLCLLQAVEDLTVERFVTQAGVEAFDEAVLPRAARGDVGRLGADGGDPGLLSFSVIALIKGILVSLRRPAAWASP